MTVTTIPTFATHPAPDGEVPDLPVKPPFMHTPYDGACRLFVRGKQDR